MKTSDTVRVERLLADLLWLVTDSEIKVPDEARDAIGELRFELEQAFEGRGF